MKTVSVILPTRNRRALLEMTLRSVLWQREVDLEVIVVDEASTDSTPALLDTVTDPRVHVIRNDAPRGVSSARNQAVAVARGEWLAFIDDDDLWAPVKLVLQLQAARDTGRHWVYTGSVSITERGAIVGGEAPSPPEHIVTALRRYNAIPGGGSNVIVHGLTLKRAGLFDLRLRNTEDWECGSGLRERVRQRGSAGRSWRTACTDRTLPWIRRESCREHGSSKSCTTRPWTGGGCIGSWPSPRFGRVTVEPPSVGLPGPPSAGSSVVSLQTWPVSCAGVLAERRQARRRSPPKHGSVRRQHGCGRLRPAAAAGHASSRLTSCGKVIASEMAEHERGTTGIRRADPIFIHGILPRSGTNFLWDLLLLHPDCCRGREPVNEDLFLDQSDHLVAFSDAVRAIWDPRWGTVRSGPPRTTARGHW